MKLIFLVLLVILNVTSAQAEWLMRFNQTYGYADAQGRPLVNLNCDVPNLASAARDRDAAKFGQAVMTYIRALNYGNGYNPRIAQPDIVQKMMTEYTNNCLVDVALNTDFVTFRDQTFEQFKKDHYNYFQLEFSKLPGLVAQDPKTKEEIEAIVRKVVREELNKKAR